VKLEQQLLELAALGLRLHPGVTIDDLLYSFDRDMYEQRPFGLLLTMLGMEVEREPWGRPFCDRVWNFDTECIDGDGSYVRILGRLCRVAGATNLLTDLADHVDLGTGEAWLAYTCDGHPRRWDVEVSDDWADELTLGYVMSDIERDGCHFYFKDNGQAMVLFYLDEGVARRLNDLSGGALQPVLR